MLCGTLANRYGRRGAVPRPLVEPAENAVNDAAPVSDPAAAVPVAAPVQPELIGVGSPLVDLVLTVDDAFLAAHVSGAKGGMQMVDAETITAIIAASGAV